MARSDPHPAARTLQPAWRQRREVLGLAILLTGATLIGCGGKPAPGGTAVVAPLFEHGGGGELEFYRNDFSPVHLPEEEALRIITDLLVGRGLAFAEGETELVGVMIRERVVDYSAGTKALAYIEYSTGLNLPYSAKRVVREGDPAPVWVDLRDRPHRVVVEYVSTDDYYELGGLLADRRYPDYRLKAVAETLRQATASDGAEDVYFAVLYDPMNKPSRETPECETVEEYRRARAEAEEAARVRAGELLGAQVQDLISWLEEQEVI